MRPAADTAGGAGMTLHMLDVASSDRWNEFVRAHPEGTFFHLAQWQIVLERAYKHPSFHCYVESQGKIRGVLPLGQIRSRLFGHSLISTPFCVYGGILAESDEAWRMLEAHACELARHLRVDYLKMRTRQLRHPDWPSSDLYATFRKRIDPDPDKNFLAIPRKQRAVVRKAIKLGLTSTTDHHVDRVYDVYSESVRNLGTPAFPRHYFRTLKEVFGEDCDLLTIALDGRPLSAVLSFRFRDEILPYYGGGTAESRTTGANDFMYWELIRRSSERGLRLFDFGRSKVGTGSFRFKKLWGFEPEPLPYSYYLVRAKKVPNLSPMNPRYRRFVNAWKYMPLGLSRILGPMLARNLG
jgi:FemAB-related protein (PEP-CTERM system-associated)